MSTNNSYIRPVMQQVINNSTSWIGTGKGVHNELISGQTFIATAEGDIDSIEVFSSIVTTPGKVQMTVHNYDPHQKSWGSALGKATVEFGKENTGKWISFKIPGIHINKGDSYGFRLESPNSYIGMGEAAGTHQQPPFTNGQEWQFTKNDQKGNSFSYFSLAFKVALRA